MSIHNQDSGGEPLRLNLTRSLADVGWPDDDCRASESFRRARERAAQRKAWEEAEAAPVRRGRYLTRFKYAGRPDGDEAA